MKINEDMAFKSFTYKSEITYLCALRSPMIYNKHANIAR